MGERGGARLPEGAHGSSNLLPWQVSPGMSDLPCIFCHNCVARSCRYPLHIGDDSVENSRQLGILTEFWGGSAAVADVIG